MPSIEWRPEVNALTTPQSFRMLFLPRNTINNDQLIAEIAEANPNYNEDAVRTILNSYDEKIEQHLRNGDQVVRENSFTYTLGLTGRLEDPEDPPPAIKDCVHVRIFAAQDFTERVQHEAFLEKRPRALRLPIISTARDTLLKLDNVLNPTGVLQLTGEDFAFEETQGGSECAIEGTESGRTVQTSLVMATNIMLLLVPDIPSQANPWNNEYRVSITTRYTEHGTARTGLYQRMLRTPLTVPGLGSPSPPETGILTDNSATPYVGVNGGTVSADERLRIQVIQDLAEGALFFSLLDMQEDGAKGTAIEVMQNGEYIIPGFADSSVSSLEITVNDYAALWEMVRNHYSGQLIDVLDVQLA